MNIAIFSGVVICLIALAWLAHLLRSDRVSLGLPVAYLVSLLLIHVPGALAHLEDNWFLSAPLYTEIGIRFTAVASVCFVLGVCLARNAVPSEALYEPLEREKFWLFCLLGGWAVTYGLSFLQYIPSIGAMIDKGGAIWMMGALFGLRYAVRRGKFTEIFVWLGAVAVFPVAMLLRGGFLSYGSAAVIVVCSVFAISVRKLSRVLVGFFVIGFLGLSIFSNYFENRNIIRDAVWYGAPLEQRIGAVTGMFTNFKFLDLTDPVILVGLDLRLNQNYFAGLAAYRIDQGDSEYLYGRSIEEALISLVPRAIWPDKPVFGGSPKIVADMTGLALNLNTSWGIGNVMEFQINYGYPGLILGFLGLGWIIGLLDRKAAIAESRGDLGSAILFFLPAVAIIQPGGSLVEVFGGGAAGLAGAYFWRWLWNIWSASPNRSDQAAGKISVA